MADEIKVRVKFLADHGDHKKDSTKTVTLSEARRLRWAGLVSEQGRVAPKKKS